MLYVNPLESAYARGVDLASAPGRQKVAYRELEHGFLYALLDEMTKSMPKNGLFKGGPEADYQREMMNDALSAAMADSGQIGLAKMMEQQEHLALLNKTRPAREAALRVMDLVSIGAG